MKHILVHADRLGDREDAVVRMLKNGVAAGRLAFVNQFVHDHRGDFVFAIERTTKPADETLQALESRRFMQHDEIAGMLDHPTPRAEVHGALVIDGWALSPHGVRDVFVLLNNGRLRYRAELFPKDLGSAYPHLRSHMSRAGFRMEFREKPKRVWMEVWFTWN